ncbi:MAG TPA: hypothetical protein VM580_23050 [Labilithrix sp.]|nr:hypothetical protein [Labilithrix sp.]
MFRQSKVGPHEVWLEPETGFIRLVHVGLIEENHARELSAIFVNSTSGEPIFIIADARRATGVTSQARRAITNDGAGWGDTPFLMAVFGAPLPVRIVNNLIFKALPLIAPSSRATMVSVATEGDARAWLTEKKAALQALAGKL